MPDPNPTPALPAAPVAEAPTALLVPLEHDDAPDTPPEPPKAAEPAVPAAPATPPAPEPVPAPPQTVPVHVLAEERRARKDAEQRFRDLSAEVQRQQQASAAVTSPQDTEELSSLAQSAMLFKADGSGQYDLDAAKRVREIMRTVAKSASQEAIAPLRQSFVTQQAQTMRERIEGEAKKAGVLEQVSQILDETMRANPDAFSDSQVGAHLGAQIILSAVGAKHMQGLASPAPVAPAATPAAPAIPPAPLMTEPAGRRPGPPADLPPELKRIAKRRGWNPERMAKTLDRVGGLSGHIAVEKDE